MAQYKRQHFVPRCYFRPFSLDNKGAAINVYNITRLRAVYNASIKGQCAKNYLYGEDLQLESGFRQVEAEYAEVLKTIQSAELEVSECQLNILRDFMLLQYSRTEAAINRTTSMMEDVHDTINQSFTAPPPEADMSPSAMMIMTLQAFGRLRETATDLKVCLIRNEATDHFVTSDDPVVLTSRLHAQKIKTNVFGVGSAGALLYLPLSPRLLLLCYDGDVYTVRKEDRWFLTTRKNKDVSACNEVQYLKAAQNLYFSNWQQKEKIESEFAVASSFRLYKTGIVSKFVEEKSSRRASRYRQVEKSGQPMNTNMLVSLSHLQILPNKWISQLSFRDKPKYRFDGSAAGYVREHTWRMR